ncbi:MAG: hypothetical protein AB8H80_22095 [Planctomycetota bacterium]
MPSAFDGTEVEARSPQRDTSVVRSALPKTIHPSASAAPIAFQVGILQVGILLAGILLAGCAAADVDPAPARTAPRVAVAVELPEGSVIVPTIARGLPDEPQFRAVDTWWHEALAQTARWQVPAPGANTPAANTRRIELTVDPRARALTATLSDPEANSDGPIVLAAGTFADDSKTPSLTQAIDRLAWSVRLALGERMAGPAPLATTAITSRDARVVDAVADADRLLRTGGFTSALRTLRVARRRDGGSPFVLAPLAALELLVAQDAEGAERTCREALKYEQRMSPNVQHRLLRTLLQARTAREPDRGKGLDRELKTLARVGQRERPYDDEPLWTEALAHNFAGEFASASEDLELLRRRYRERPFLTYHLGWANLGLGNAGAAATYFDEAALRLPSAWVLLPRAIALFEAERHDDLTDMLERAFEQLARDSTADDMLGHQLLRMQAAHALLLGDRDAARRLMLRDMTWLLQHPLMLETRAGELAETGAVLVRLGSSDRLPPLLAAVQKAHPGSPVADAAAFVAGLHTVRTSGLEADATIDMLERDGDTPWGQRLRAFVHERRGEVGDMQTALGRAARLSSSPMTTALLAHSLVAVGKERDAERLRETLRRELLDVHLRRPCRHPVFGPELAFAFSYR